MNKVFSYIFPFSLIFLASQTFALPVFTKQTGEGCSSCHLNIGELTPAGRKFKLMGYSAGQRVLPFSFSAVASLTHINSTSSSLSPSVSMPKNGSIIPETGSAYLAGKYWDDLGGYVKLTFNLANTTPVFGSQGVQTGAKVGSDSFLDASEIRYSREFSMGGHDIIWGATFNNAPGVQDLWVTTPVNSFPYKTSGLLNAWGIGQFGPATMIDGGLTSQVAGLGIYTMIDDNIYAEFSNYRGTVTGVTALDLSGPIANFSSSFNPYWRLSYNKVAGQNSYMFGTFGLISNLSRDPLIPGSSSAQYRDIGFDAEYQHITDTHSYSAQLTFIDEHVDWNARSVGRNHDFSTSNLYTLKTKLTYDYGRKYGTNLFGFLSNGTQDNLYWAYNSNPAVITGACNQTNSLLSYCSLNGKPQTIGYGFEFYYVPIPNVHVALQQTTYTKFLGGSTFVDNSSGAIRRASDNNFTYLYILFSY